MLGFTIGFELDDGIQLEWNFVFLMGVEVGSLPNFKFSVMVKTQSLRGLCNAWHSETAT